MKTANRKSATDRVSLSRVRRLSPEQKARIEALLREGWPIGEIARIVRFSRITVRYHREASGITVEQHRQASLAFLARREKGEVPAADGHAEEVSAAKQAERRELRSRPAGYVKTLLPTLSYEDYRRTWDACIEKAREGSIEHKKHLDYFVLGKPSAQFGFVLEQSEPDQHRPAKLYAGGTEDYR
jgi:Helix-turn-helix domain